MRGIRPRYSDSKVTLAEKQNQWKKIAGPDGSQSPVSIHQDATIYATDLEAGQKSDFTVEMNRHAWLQVARGTLIVNGTTVKSGDAVATSRAAHLHVEATESTDALLFDLA